MSSPQNPYGSDPRMHVGPKWKQHLMPEYFSLLFHLLTHDLLLYISPFVF